MVPWKQFRGSKGSQKVADLVANSKPRLKTLMNQGIKMVEVVGIEPTS